MEKARKNLKISSIVILILAGFSLLNIIFGLFFGPINEAIDNVAGSEEIAKNIVDITRIIILVVSVLLLLPHLYIGIKGIKIANKPNDSGAHIVWGIILIVLTAIGFISPIGALIQGNGEILDNVSSLCNVLFDFVVLIEYVKYARDVQKEF